MVLGNAANARGHRPIYQRIVKNRLGCTTPSAVVPAKAGTHNHRKMLLDFAGAPALAKLRSVVMGSGLPPKASAPLGASPAKPWRRRVAGTTPASIQIHIELIRALAADQRQLQRGAIGLRPGREALELEGEALYPGRAVLQQFRNWQRPVRRRAFDEQADFLCLGRADVDQHALVTLAPDIADRHRNGVADIRRLRHAVERGGKIAVLGAGDARKGQLARGFDWDAEL